MSKSSVWNIQVPSWAAETISILKAMDASDALPDSPQYDERYLGVNVRQLASKYINAEQTKRAPLERLFRAASGLHDYAASLASLAKQYTDPLELAMFEGISAYLEGRDPDLRSVAGFGRNYIQEEFRAYLSGIIDNSANTSGSWAGFWRSILSGCNFDLFVSTGRLTGADGNIAACVF